ncbi:MAG: protein kinase [Verrucomicrobiota bacterium]
MLNDVASNLLGRKIGRWNVEKKLSGAAGQGGGGFSSGYLVRDDAGTKGYLKAINVHYAFQSTGKNFADLMNEITGDYIHERDLLKFCEGERMDRIVRAVDGDIYTEPGQFIPVPFLVFEHCEKGDVARHSQMSAPGLGWRLKIFQGAAVGLWQLHRHDIAHQDMKPANLLVFGDDISKIADLGRSTRNQTGARFGSPGDAGDISYGPLELWYRVNHPDWAVRRKATDLFMLGGILAFLIGNVNLLSSTLGRLPSSMQPKTRLNPGGWNGTYEDLIPALRKALCESVAEIVAPVREDLRFRIERLLLWLCEPDPLRRGHPETVGQASGDRYSLERILSVADRLAADARIPEKK